MAIKFLLEKGLRHLVVFNYSHKPGKEREREGEEREREREREERERERGSVVGCFVAVCINFFFRHGKDPQ
jgi:hypothetical protein